MSEIEDTPGEQAPDSEETLARKQGWVSQEEWSEQGKEVEEWIPATRFNARGDFLGEIKRYRSQVEELEGKVSNFGELMTEQVKATREAALKEVESRHRQAVEDGDTEGAGKALREVQEITRQPEPVPAVDPVQEFMDSRPEIRDDIEKFREFREIDQFVAMRNNRRMESPDDVRAHLVEVARVMDEKQPPKHEETPGRTTESRGSKVSYRELPDYAKAICDDAVAKGLMSQQEYVDSFVEAGGMNE